MLLGFISRCSPCCSLYQVRTIQHTVASEHELAAISFRLGVTSTEQLARITQMGNYAEKYLVTSDTGYLDKFLETAHAYGFELDRLRRLPLSVAERRWIAPLDSNWQKIAVEAQQLADHRKVRPDSASPSLAHLRRALELRAARNATTCECRA